MDAYNDLTPRVGVAYDLFGNGQDGAEVQLGQVPGVRGERLAVHVDEPRRDHRPQRQNRGWTDGNGDLVVDCDLLNPARRRSTASAPRGHGHRAATSASSGAATMVDPGVLSGWGVRPGDTQYTVTVQQQLIPRVSADFSDTHRSVPRLLRHRRSATRRGDVDSSSTRPTR